MLIDMPARTINSLFLFKEPGIRLHIIKNFSVMHKLQNFNPPADLELVTSDADISGLFMRACHRGLVYNLLC